MINRADYMQILWDFKDKKVIKVVTGIRRCGKSTLLKLFEKRLLIEGTPSSNIIFMNFESVQFSHIQGYLQLYNELKRRITKTGKTYIFLDEIQMIPEWEKAVNSCQVDFDADIYITGSNAYLLSSELSTVLSGRYVEIKMLPLSFKEYLDFNSFGTSTSLDEKFQSFLKYGGMPAVAEYEFNSQRINEMLEGVYSTVILKDVMARTNISDQSTLQKVVLFLADNIGNLTSPNNIGNILTLEEDIDEGKRRKSPAGKTVETYIASLQNAFIFYGIRRYDIKGKEFLKTIGKYYIVDTGIRNMLLGYRDVDRGHILENVVYFELLRRGFRLSIGKVGDQEIDFIAEKPDEKIYFQIAESIASSEVLARETAPLRAIKDNYRKVILSIDRSYISSYEGIEMVNLVDFLMIDPNQKRPY